MVAVRLVSRRLQSFKERVPHLSWAKLNADGIFIALLAIGLGIIHIVEVQDNPIVLLGRTDEIPLVYARALGYIVGGLVMLYAFLRSRIYEEVVGRFILMAAVAFQVWRRILEFGVFHPDVESILLALILLVLTTFLRLRALFVTDGLTITVPPTTAGDEQYLHPGNAYTYHDTVPEMVYEIPPANLLKKEEE